MSLNNFAVEVLYHCLWKSYPELIEPCVSIFVLNAQCITRIYIIELMEDALKHSSHVLPSLFLKNMSWRWKREREQGKHILPPPFPSQKNWVSTKVSYLFILNTANPLLIQGLGWGEGKKAFPNLGMSCNFLACLPFLVLLSTPHPTIRLDPPLCGPKWMLSIGRLMNCLGTAQSSETNYLFSPMQVYFTPRSKRLSWKKMTHWSLLDTNDYHQGRKSIRRC